MQNIKEILANPGHRDPRATEELRKFQERITAETPPASSVSQTSSSSDAHAGECQDCHGTTWVQDGDRNAMKRCRCLIERRIRGMLPVRFHQARLTDFSGAMQKAVTEWIAKPSDGLLLQGGVGAGKTHAVSAIVRLLMESRAEVKFTRAADFYARVRETYSQNGNPEQLTEAGVIGEFSTVRFCVLDDLGSGNLSDHERRCTLELLDQRLNALLPTIVTTNWSLKEISERMDERIASRLSGYTLLAFKGEDRRQK